MTAAGDRGLLDSDGMIWRVNREVVLLLGGARAVLMQIAHPLVAAGVAGHSDFLNNPLERFQETLRAALAISFGSVDEAEATWRRIDSIHGGVTGRLKHPSGSFSAATAYAARDPELLLWVHATLIDSSLLVYQRYVRKLSGAEQSDFYQESKKLAHLFRIPTALVPADLAEFELYMRQMIDSTLAVSDEAGVLARKVLYPLRYVPRPIFDVFNLATVGLLPPKVRAMYGFEWNPAREMLLDGSARTIRMMLPLIPEVLRVWPAARAGENRAGFGA
jgi:uncharacterized protein (DUF2236 family)